MPDDLWDLFMSQPCQGKPKLSPQQVQQALNTLAAAADWDKVEHKVLVWWSAGLLLAWVMGWKERLVWRGLGFTSYENVDGSKAPNAQLSIAGA
jgi:hypothetical protein